ncbi:MAG: hypothetical protein QXR28_04820, partial [Nitrososphaerota archaeon]
MRILLLITLLLPLFWLEPTSAADSRIVLRAIARRPRPLLGAHFNFADGPNEVLLEMRKPRLQDSLAGILRDSGIEDLRMSFHGYYSHMSPEATERLKKETRLSNQFPWFPIEDYIGFIKKYHFTTVLGVNVEEGPEVAADLLERFKRA